MTAAVTGLIVAAGSGERLHGDAPKAFVDLAGEPLLLHAVRAFVACAVIDDVVLVVGPAHLDRAARALDGARLAVSAVVAGGDTRQESVGRGVDACPPGTAVIAVHDAARPLVTGALITRTVGALVDPWAAVAPGLPVVDTVKLVDTEQVVHTVDRRGLSVVQTPQVFAARTLHEVHTGVGQDASDDLLLVEQGGGRVRLIPGDRRNFKVTYPEDLLIAEALLAAPASPPSGAATRPGGTP